MRWWSSRFWPGPTIVALCGSLALHGCEAGYPPAAIENAPWNNDAAAIAAARKELQVESEGAARVTDRLIATEAGRLLVRSLRAHGGWDSWAALERLSYARTRRLETPGVDGKVEEDSPGVRSPVALDMVALRFLCPVATFLPGKEVPSSSSGVESVHPAHFELLHPSAPGREGLFARLWAAAAPAAVAPVALAELPDETVADEPVAGQDLAEEAFLASLPFCLEDPELLAEHLGIEEDLREGTLLERVRYTWPERRARTLCVAWFDRSTFLLRRVLLRIEDGRMLLVDLSDWVDAGGLRVPARRDIHRISRLYERPGPEDPRIVDRLEGFLAERPAAP